VPPRVSVVTPSLNQGEFLEATIRSVLDQDYPDVEYMVVDGGSTDDSVDVIRRHEARLAWWVSEPDRGQSHAINKGWQRATGEIVAWLNADDLYTPCAISRAVAVFARHPHVDLIYGDCYEFEEDPAHARIRHVGTKTLRGLLTASLDIPQPTVFLKRSLLDRIGILDESLHLTMDYHLLLRAFAFGRPHYVSGPPLASIRVHPAAKSFARAASFPTELIETLDHFYALPDLPTEALRARRLAYAQYAYARADMALSVRKSYLEGIAWLVRAYLGNPSLLARLPRAVWRTLIGARAAAWRERTLADKR
jgi:glycosyltransferase involved in cell wall biosynthesis